ncbi:hypothetical protein BOTBODRAFT_130168 [Botryobasidium botryosum FD-172 SS1]|uniref:Cytochrome c oxidase assembly protein COX16, mitochondrial n=1 Tax=Botryobasidium botryosum (strain FD-172 SS1) TaxID=930990 RepID=A0A067MKU0_BOTB1|nr:hypothetical protein BOTBODRAFT_130168 [Botryobasidium botryosum FD-172 SS1]
MAVFPSESFPPRPPSTLNRQIRRNPLLFGIPFILTIVGASFALQTVTQTRYDLHDRKVTQVSKEEELKMSKNRKKFDIREEYYRLQGGGAADDWEPVRVPRPEGVPEWGMAEPTKPS